MAVNK